MNEQRDRKRSPRETCRDLAERALAVAEIFSPERPLHQDDTRKLERMISLLDDMILLSKTRPSKLAACKTPSEIDITDVKDIKTQCVNKLTTWRIRINADDLEHVVMLLSWMTCVGMPSTSRIRNIDWMDTFPALITICHALRGIAP